MTVAPGWASGMPQAYTLVPGGIALPCITIPVMYVASMMSRALSHGTMVI
jgi:hypothetical protein